MLGPAVWLSFSELLLLMNNIPVHQNAPRNLRRLAAQRVLYAEAKRVLGIQLLISAPAVVVWSILATLYPNLKPYAGLWACSATLLDVLLFGPMIKNKKTTAAKIQEEFDCEVLELAWCDCKVGDRSEPENMAKANSLEREKSEFDKLRDWYPTVVGEAPIHIGRLVCQRANCWWERTLREKYSLGLTSFYAISGALIVVITMASGLSVLNAVTTLLLLQPLIIVGMKTHREHADAAGHADRLKKTADTLWRKSISGQLSEEQATHEARHLQNEIYDHRTRAPLVFDRLYSLFRNSQEEEMHTAAEDLMEQYRRERPKTHGAA